MNILDAIGILLFILPGILAEKISHKVDFPTGRKRNDFLETVNGIALSFPILLAVTLYIRKKYCFTKITRIVEKMDNLDFLLEICLYTLITTIITGILYIPVKVFLRWIVNKFRKKYLNKMETDDKSCWRRFLIDENKYKFLEVIIGGKKYKGFLGPFSLPNEEREITLETYDDLLCDPEYNPRKLFTKVKSTYIDLEKNIVVRNYDTKDFESWLNQKKNNHNM